MYILIIFCLPGFVAAGVVSTPCCEYVKGTGVSDASILYLGVVVSVSFVVVVDLVVILGGSVKGFSGTIVSYPDVVVSLLLVVVERCN